jgi:GNAT superfamily N-acetyltransferase
MANDIKIRKFSSHDEASIQALIKKILADEFPESAHAYPVDDLNDISGSYGKLGEAFFVASQNGNILGTVGIKCDDERTALLRRLFVSAEARGKRLGERLLDRAIQFAFECGYNELIFKTTSTMDQALSLGKKKGFVPKARIEVGPIQLLKFALNLKRVPLAEK